MIKCPYCTAPGSYLHLLTAKKLPHQCRSCGKPLKARYSKVGRYGLIGVTGPCGVISTVLANHLSHVVAVQWLLLILLASVFGAVGAIFITIFFLQLEPLESTDNTTAN